VKDSTVGKIVIHERRTTARKVVAGLSLAAIAVAGALLWNRS